MESNMLKMLKSQNPEKEYPTNTGQKWTNEEENLLLEELNKDICIRLIAETHKRTVGGINTRRQEIAYKLYVNGCSMDEIINKTKLDEYQINDAIKRRKNKPIIETQKPFSIESEISIIKNDIKELKNSVKELVEMMKAVYEFEEA